MRDTEIKERASAKAFSKLQTLDFEISTIKKNITTKMTGGVTVDEMIGVLDHTETDKLVWMYISSLIEKDNKL